MDLWKLLRIFSQGPQDLQLPQFFIFRFQLAFAGKGIAELQEGGLVGATLLDWAPRAPWIGLYPTAQTLVLQLTILSLIVGGLIWTFVIAPRFLQAVSK